MISLKIIELFSKVETAKFLCLISFRDFKEINLSLRKIPENIFMVKF